jgi:amino acid adenylation domain-containing protein
LSSETERPRSFSAAKRALLDERLKGRGTPAPDAAGIPKRPRPDRAPLSFAQQQLWVIDQMAGGTSAYNLPYGFRLRGMLDRPALEAAINEVVGRHEVLRTTFAVEHDEPFQVIHPECRIHLTEISVEDIPSDQREAGVRRLASAEAGRPFDLARLPLVRVTLFRLSVDDHVLLINLHHVLADGLSVSIMLRELDACYTAAGARPDLPALPVQYGDYADWQRRTFNADAGISGRLDFWTACLTGVPSALELPVDRPRPARQSFAGSNVFFEIPPPTAHALHAIGAREDCTPFVTMLAAFEVLLQRYTGERDFVVGTPLAIRPAPELGESIGNFLSMAPLRCNLSDQPDFPTVLRRTRGMTLDALTNGDVPLDLILSRLALERPPDRNPLFQVLFEMLPAPPLRLGALDVRQFHFDLPFAQFDLALHLREEAGAYVGRFEYCADLFRPESVARLAEHFGVLLDAIAADSDLSVSSLPIMPSKERHRLLRAGDGPAARCPEVTVPALIEAQIRRVPDRPALREGEHAWTYAQLGARAAEIATWVAARGIGRGDRVGLCLERGGDLVAAMVGVLQAGAAYVPLDPGFPPARLRFMRDDAGLALVLSTRDVAQRCSLPAERLLLLDGAPGGVAPPAGPSPAPLGSARPRDPAYVLYTSGSSGQPKGVMIPHRAVVNFLTSMAHEPGLAETDIAVLELLLPLTVGATVVIATRAQSMDGLAIRTLLERHRVTVMQATPVTWRLLLLAGWTGGAPFRALVGGESLSPDLAERLLSLGVELWNMYGPTETTVWSTCARITDIFDGITIGRPIANTIVRVLDAHLDLCPVGVPGELYIGGLGVADGYWRRAELTAERFIADPFDPMGAGRLYRTGDRVRWRNDDALEHLGRLDDQVKVHGYRIELGEIETAIARVPGVREAAVAVRQGPTDDPCLVAYLVATHTGALVATTVHDALRVALPKYMVPDRYVVLEALPRTPNGKINRAALPSHSANDVERRRVTTPRTPGEATVLALVRDVLGREDVGVLDNFFALGGTSIMAARLVLRLRDTSGHGVPLGVLFERPTVATIAELLDALALSEPSDVRQGTAGRVEIEL